MAASEANAKLDTGHHDRRLAKRLREDAVFRSEFERQAREIAQIDAIVNELEALREHHGLTKADLAREVGKHPASIRRLLTAPANPELRTVVAMASALDADVRIVPRRPARQSTRSSRAA